MTVPRTRRILIAAVASLVVAAVLVGAAHGSTLVIGQSTDAESVDPHKVDAVVAAERLYNLYDTLVNIDFDMQTITPGLAESWTISPDGKTYTFVLKPGVKFHSGKPLTAKDVKFSFDRWRDPATASPTRFRIADVEQIIAKDDHTVVIRLKERSNYLLFNLASAFASIVNADAIKKHGANYGTLAVDGTGPFRFKEWVLRERFVIERNPEYAWGPSMFKNRGPARVGRVVWRMVPEEVLYFELAKGRIDVSRWVAFAALARLRKEPALRVIDYKVGYVVYLEFNVSREPVADVRVRRAINHAIRKENIVNEIFSGVGVPADGPMSPIVAGAWKDAGKAAYPHDQRKARVLLDDAGWTVGADGVRVKDGKPLTLPIVAISGYGYPATLTLIQSQLREVGIVVEPVLVSEAAIWSYLRKGGYTAYAMGNPHSNPDELLFLCFHSRNLRFTIPEVDQLLAEGRATEDTARWHEVYAEVQKRVIDRALWVPLWHPGRAMTMRAKVRDLRPHPVYDVGYHKLVDVAVDR